MSTLTNVIRLLDNITSTGPDVQRPLDWPSWRLNTYLQKCPTHHDTLRWHHDSLKKILQINDNSLKQLCLGVADCIVRATEKLEKLRVWSARDPVSPTNRHVVISSLKDIKAAFSLFSIVSTDDDLGRPEARDVVLAYLRRTYGLMIMIGWVLEPCDDEHDWFMEEYHYLQATELQNFKFDSDSDYHTQIANSSLIGVIIDHAEIPESCLPAFPEAAVFCRNTGPYGPRILQNLLHTATG